MPGPHPTPLIRSATALVLVLLVLAVSIPPSTATQRGPSGPDPVGVWPLIPDPEVVRGFDPPGSPYGAGHRGVDLLGSTGQQVRTALPGTVGFAGKLAGKGVVVVSHGGTRTTYEPVSASVSVGDEVAAGEAIGTLDAAPSHCRPRVCLHWGWIRDVDDVYLDPLRLVGGGPVRLLPFLTESLSRSAVPSAGEPGIAPSSGALELNPLLRLLRPWWPA